MMEKPHTTHACVGAEEIANNSFCTTFSLQCYRSYESFKRLSFGWQIFSVEHHHLYKNVLRLNTTAQRTDRRDHRSLQTKRET